MHIIAPSFPIVKVGINIFLKFYNKQPADFISLQAVFIFFMQFYICPVLQMLVPWNPVVPLEQERLDHRGQLHVEVEEVDREGHNKECETSGQQIQ